MIITGASIVIMYSFSLTFLHDSGIYDESFDDTDFIHIGKNQSYRKNSSQSIRVIRFIFLTSWYLPGKIFIFFLD